MERHRIGYAKLEGIHVRIDVEEGFRGDWKVVGHPTIRGKESKHYRTIRRKLGDDWDFDITNTWGDDGKLPRSMQERIADIVVPGWRER